MKKSILTMFLIVLISPLSSAIAGGMTGGIALCSGGASNAVDLFAYNFTPAPTGGSEKVCMDACSAHAVGCKNTAKESTKCVLGVINDVLQQVTEDCNVSEDPAGCIATTTALADYKTAHAAQEKSDAESSCDAQLPVCITLCQDLPTT